MFFTSLPCWTPRRGRFRGALAALAIVAICAAAGSRARGITLAFDYSYDAGGFFGTAQAPTPARTALELAGRTFEAFGDLLAAIQPGGANSWTARFNSPADGSLANVPNLAVPADTLVVFAGVYDLQGSRLGEAGPGIAVLGAGASAPFVAAATNRGQGSSTIDFAPWGGSIAFDTTAIDSSPRNWSFDLDAPPGPLEYDFYSVAVHELAHLLGFGTGASFLLQENNGAFTGSSAMALYGAPVPLQAGGAHWAASVTSPPFADPEPRPSLGPSLGPGVRRLFTPLDYAALADTGWDVPSQLVDLPGDVNLDGVVDGTDFLTWQRGLGAGSGLATLAGGDVSGDRRIDDFDGWIISQRFGAAVAIASTAAAGVVPEPAAVLLAVLGGASLARRRRRRA